MSKNVTLEDVAIETVTRYGTSSGRNEVYDILNKYGFADPDGELTVRILEMVRTATVRVKVQFF